MVIYETRRYGSIHGRKPRLCVTISCVTIPIAKASMQSCWYISPSQFSLSLRVQDMRRKCTSVRNPSPHNRKTPVLHSQTPVMSKQLLRGQVLGSALVDNAGKFETLAALLGKSVKTLKLEALYSTRTSGWNNPAAFHAACDSKGPTLVLIQCSDGFGYGGYSSVSWNSTGSYQQDSAAFLFRLPNFASCRTKQPTETFARRTTAHDIYGHPSFGPTFGGGHDLMTFNASGQILVCNASSYATTGTLVPNTVSKDANSCHMEVLSVCTSDFAYKELEQPWLSGCTWLAQVMFCHFIIMYLACSASPFISAIHWVTIMCSAVSCCHYRCQLLACMKYVESHQPMKVL